jgi:putative ATPase
MTDLFEQETSRAPQADLPLAARMRPRALADVVGQDHVLGPGKLLRRSIEADRIGSLVLYGPPGCGKTSLGEVIAQTSSRVFERTSGVLANVAALRELLKSAQLRRRRHGRETILFIDEIHRFNRSQQDTLLPYVEDGVVTLIGATTHNPFFFVNSPLLSRSLVVQLEPLNEPAITTLLRRALQQDDVLMQQQAQADPDALAHLASVCEGDARRALNALEIGILSTPPDAEGRRRFTRAVAEDSVQTKAVVYDHDEDGHYDTISAFIKSVRGSDPHAAVYWLAKMLCAGEDPRFIARRLIILASEDIGNADPRGLSVAVAALQAMECVGMPEARIVLSQATTYLACAPKSNAAYLAIDRAMQDVRDGRVQPVPPHLRSTGYRGAAPLGHQGYQYAHDGPGHFVDQIYLPTSRVYYEPSDQGYEATLRKRMAVWDERRAQAGPAEEGGEPRR